MELSKEALAREFEEELHAKIVVDDLIAVCENFFPWGTKPCHQICLYYNVHLQEEGSIPMNGIFHGYDELDKERIDLDFCWVDFKDLERGLKVYPLELIPHILADKKKLCSWYQGSCRGNFI